jgi:two-component system, OmpR family, phosphate regulon response regulator PhoB
MQPTKILLVEDDQSLSEIVSYNLRLHGFDVTTAGDGQTAIACATETNFSIVLLDVMLPGLDGIEVCRRLRQISSPQNDSMVIIILTAKAEESDQLLGFSVGADEYVVKPFSIRVLLERVKAIQRRITSLSSHNECLHYDELVIDTIAHRVTISQEAINLTPSEFRLLETLMRKPGRAFERKDLIDHALGEDAVVLERTIDVHIRSLRKKLGRLGDSIETVRGVGYRFHA